MNRVAIIWSRIVIVVCFAAAAGCGGGSDRECESGARQGCTCPTGGPGNAACSSDGRWGACTCSATPGDLSEPAPADMATPPATCSGETDTLGHCCHGDDCCAARNHSHASGGSCACDSGYVPGPGFSDSNRVCVAGKADLWVTSSSVTYYLSTPSNHTMALCLNSRPDGSYDPEGNFVEIENGGDGAIGSIYHVGLGIVRVGTGEVAACSDMLYDDHPQSVGSLAYWRGPWCCTLSTGGVPSGYFATYVYADVLDEIPESNERNNYAVAGNFYVYGY